jgi:hypothetical protein
MDSLISFLCLCSFFVPTLFGVAVALLLKRSLKGWAYLVGWLAPLLLLFGLFAIYVLWIWATPCEPVGSLECGEPVAYAFILFAGVFALTAIANAIAQGVMFLFFPGQAHQSS